ncbi:MAG: gliding motility protein GldN [Verrucomicrobia bacterium]|mgnify:CR=1 FL=1|nr:gliding motility protein GldN [Verrucomicrobiota bacterium]
MRTILKISFLGVLFALTLLVEAQENKVLDGAFIKETAPTRRVVPYTHLREADVMYYKRVWREIDIREKMNHSLYYPTSPINEIGYKRMSLYDIIKQGVDEGTLTPYESEDFAVELTKADAFAKLSREIVTFEEDLNTGALNEVVIQEPIGGVDIAKYWIKEDWFFDRERSVMEVRIIGLLPIVNELDGDGNFKGLKGLFWIYFPEARYVLANHEVYNASNDGARVTFEDYFRKRQFSSYIRQETNVYDNRILDAYTQNVDRLLEARRIEDEIIMFEHDLWQY